MFCGIGGHLQNQGECDPLLVIHDASYLANCNPVSFYVLVPNYPLFELGHKLSKHAKV